MIHSWTARLLISLAVVVSACGGTAPASSSTPSALLPATLPEASGRAEQVIRIRVYAGADYRMRVLDWQEEVRRMVGAASSLVQMASGTRLELAGTVEWKRSGGELLKTLASLRLLDPGRDVDLVLGLIDAPEKRTDLLSELTAYELLGRHVLVRSFPRQLESEALQPALGELSEAAQDRLLLARARHKQSVLLANAIAHLLGAEDGPPAEVDASSYDIHQQRLSAAAGARLRITVPAQLADTPEGWQRALQGLTEQSAQGPLLERARARLRAAEEGAGEQPAADSLLREVDREALREASKLIASHKAEEAWVRIEALLDLYPDAPELFLPACQSAQMRMASDAIKRCRRATKAQPKAAAGWVALAMSQVQESTADARESLDQAAELLARDHEDSHRESWAAIARAYQKLSLPRAAQRAAKQANLEAVLRWAAELQSRYGTSVGVTEEREAVYLKAVKTGLKFVYASDSKRAQESAISLSKTFPKSPGAALIRCEILLRKRSYKAATKACGEVLKLQGDNSWAHYLLGLLAGREKNYAAAIATLARAIELDPTLKAAYQTLADIYRKTGDTRRAELERLYKERFQSELR